MSAQRQDYLIRLIEELGRFVREVVHSGEPPRVESALPAILQAQEKLFGLPAAGFLNRSLEEQVELLARGETVEAAVDKCVTYAGILHHAAQLYTALDRPALALGARQLAETVLQTAAVRWPAHAAKIEEEVRGFATLTEE